MLPMQTKKQGNKFPAGMANAVRLLYAVDTKSVICARTIEKTQKSLIFLLRGVFN